MASGDCEERRAGWASALVCGASAVKDRARVGREETGLPLSVFFSQTLHLLYLLKHQDCQAITWPQSQIVYFLWAFRVSHTQNLELMSPIQN